MNNRINSLFANAKNIKLSIYFTAGFPQLDSTVPIIQSLEQAGVDFIEIGIPFSDPIADGPVIQASSQQALKNGMNLRILFDQLKDIRKSVNIPLLMMGYLNPILQFGFEIFLKHCNNTGIDGLILPDLPVDLYIQDYKSLFQKHQISFIPLITPASSPERIRHIDDHTNGFIYMVSTHSTTGGKISLQNQIEYFQSVKAMHLENPLVVGFGIQSKVDIEWLGQFADGAIIGSAFVSHLGKNKDLSKIENFISDLVRSDKSQSL